MIHCHWFIRWDEEESKNRVKSTWNSFYLFPLTKVKDDFKFWSNTLKHNMLVFTDVTKAKGMKAGFTKLPANFPYAQSSSESSPYVLETQPHIHIVPQRIQPSSLDHDLIMGPQGAPGWAQPFLLKSFFVGDLKYSLIQKIKNFLTHWLHTSEKEKTLAGHPGSRSSINNNLFADGTVTDFHYLNTLISSNYSTKQAIRCACVSLAWPEVSFINSHFLNLSVYLMR